MNEIKIFENTEFGSIRTLEIDGEPYLGGTDVANILGYTNPQKAIRDHVDEEDKTVNDSFTVNGTRCILINESGLYSLILSSKLPTAKQFKRWVTSEVLPSIRKTGMYATDELLNNPDLAIKAFTALKEERAKTKALTETVAVQQQQILEMKPKASYYETVLNCKDLLSTTEIAKDYGRSARWLNDLLHEMKVQYKQGGKIWILYQKYAEKGYTSTKTQTYNGKDGEVHTKVHTYWTQKGRLFIYDLLKSKGILPLIEQEKSA
ncbi:MAG: phage antirepressor KilAC domain-containing protein [Pseudoruminococcus massiliensis]|uniref:phage antirepressor KilAC domain-containing protein n=1 Tax=Pseudoruminococcus massiliensis TaxID=2086583 RepID=UPI00399517D7